MHLTNKINTYLNKKCYTIKLVFLIVVNNESTFRELNDKEVAPMLVTQKSKGGIVDLMFLTPVSFRRYMCKCNTITTCDIMNELIHGPKEAQALKLPLN